VIRTALLELRSKVPQDEIPIIENLLATTSDLRVMRPVAAQCEAALSVLDTPDVGLVAERLARQMAEVRLSRTFYDDFVIAMEVLASSIPSFGDAGIEQ
jgi:hypothetical protein